MIIEGMNPLSPFTVMASMDKFRGTATARQLCDTLVKSLEGRDCGVDVQPMSDGGEGFRDAFEGDVIAVEVPGPWGVMVRAEVTMVATSTGVTAVLEVADVVGRHLLVSPTSEEALAASSAGVGHLIVAAITLGAQSVLVGCGGSATSDGGLGCYEVLVRAGGLSVPLTAATDVTARFSGARRYAEQKGVDPTDLDRVDQLLRDARARYESEQGVDVETMDRAGASGGIPGGLAALGGRLASGFNVVAQSVGLADRIARSSLVVTGEGRFDEGSLEGKVTVGIAELVRDSAALLVVCGSIDDEAARIFRRLYPSANLVSLVERFGERRSMTATSECLASVLADEMNTRFA
jgi:glycerate kinase